MLGKTEKMQAKREMILECSRTLFVKKGYIDTSIRDIIESSGYGASTFYRYFASREEILNTLLTEFLDTIIQRVNELYAVEKDLRMRFIESKRSMLEVFVENPEMAEIYSRASGISEGIDKCLKSFDDRFIEFSSQNISYGINRGLFKDMPVKPIAHAILGIIKFDFLRICR